MKAHRLTLQLRAFLEIWFPFTIQQLRCFLFPCRESNQSSGREAPRVLRLRPRLKRRSMRGQRGGAFRGPPAPLSLRGGERPDSIGKVGGTTDDNRGPTSTISLWSCVLVICPAKPDYRAFLHRLHQRHGPASEGAQWGEVQCDKGGPTMDYRLP